jgi:hypothetical protein
MNYLLIIFTFIAFSSQAFACETKKIIILNKTYEVCFENKKIYTQQCENIQKCFPKPKKPLKFQSNKNPLFLLCNQSGGTPHFVKVKGFKEIFSICLKQKNKIVDLESLMNHYKTNIR